MKKIKYFILLFILIIITGCSNYDVNMKINKDKSMNYSILIISDSYDETIANDILSYKEKYEQFGFNILEYNQDGKYGIKITKDYADIDDISKGIRNEEFDLLYLYSNGYDQDFESKMFSLEKGIDTNRYAANFYVDFSNMNINSNAKITYTVELPQMAISNNANIVSEDGRILTWNISSVGKTEIDYVFELNSYDYIYYGIAVVILIFLVFSIFGNLFGGNNKDNKKNDGVNDIYHQNVEVRRNVIVSSNNKILTTNNDKNDLTAKNKVNNKNTNIVTNNSVTDKNELSSLTTPEKKKKSLFGKKGKNVVVEPTKVSLNDEFNAMIETVNNGSVNYNTNSNPVYVNNNDNNNLPDPFGNGNDSNKENNTGGLEDWYVSDESFDRNNNSNMINIKPITQNSASSDVNIDTSINNNTNINTNVNVNNSLDVNYDTSVVNNNVINNNLNDTNNEGPVIRVNSKQVVVSNEKEDV